MDESGEGPQKQRKRKKRRLASDLEENEKWNCPWNCGKFYRNTSTKSIHQHLEECPNKGLNGPVPEELLVPPFVRNESGKRAKTEDSKRDDDICKREAKIKSRINEGLSKKVPRAHESGSIRRQPARSSGTKTKKASSSKKGNHTGGRKVTSRYIGVSYHANRGKWQVKIRSNGKQKHLGYFEDEDDAARAYNKAARAVHTNPKINQVSEDGASEDSTENLSLNARIQDITKVQQKEVNQVRTMKPRRSREKATYGQKSSSSVNVASNMKNPPPPTRTSSRTKKWTKPMTSLLDVEVDEEEDNQPRRNEGPPVRKPPAALRMKSLTKEVDTPTLFGGGGRPFSPGKTTRPPLPSSSVPIISTLKTSTFRGVGRRKTNLKQRRGSGIQNLKVDIGIGKSSKRTVRQDAMLKLTPVTNATGSSSGISGGKPGFYMESPSLGTHGTPRETDAPGNLFPEFSPAFNTYCT